MSICSERVFGEPVQKRQKVELNESLKRTKDEFLDKENRKRENFEKKQKNYKLIVKYTQNIIIPIILSILALFTRIYRIAVSNRVIWDEAHFGKFSSYYIKRQFYFDVHPPLAKTLIGLSGFLSGHNGSFEFPSGQLFPTDLNYFYMRAFCALFGALCVPLAYFTALEMKFSLYASILVGLMVLCDNSLATISRFILLDSFLLFFSMITIFSLFKFHSYRDKPFTYRWFKWLLLTGTFIGFVCSVKWIGVFIAALCGVYTLSDLWIKFGDYKMPKAMYLYHWLVRILALILVPFLFYVLTFWIHFLILYRSGPGDAQMSSLFQANLYGTDISRSPAFVAYGSKVTIKNMGYAGGLLHSHIQTFPFGSNQQQVTCYHHKDGNNDWHIHPIHGLEPLSEQDPILFLKNNDTFRLIHTSTGCNLHSHPIPAPITRNQYEVSCYGNLTIGDDNDHWVIEIIKDSDYTDPRIKTIKTAFRLRHSINNCYLRAARVHLPQWGFRQIEVTCDEKNNIKDYYTHWNIENHWNERLPPADTHFYRSCFWNDFVHINIAMMNTNNALVLESGKKDDLISRPWQWPTAVAGVRMCSWDDTSIKYYLLGNPAVYWLSSASILLLFGLILFYTIRWKRHYVDFTQDTFDQFYYFGVYPMLGWAFHYLPFFIIKRVLYLHHYFPALLFAILTTGFVFDYFTRFVPSMIRNIIFTVTYIVISLMFLYFKDITFGMEGPSKNWAHLNWLPSWAIS